MFAIKHLFHINSPKETVYNCIASVEGLAGWWTVQTEGLSVVGEYLEFRFGDRWFNKMKVISLREFEYIEWECTEGAPEWIGTRISFFLDSNEEKTRVRFSHSGWLDDGDFFSICNFAWARYMHSLRDLCQTGVGAAFGSDQYKP